MEMPYSNGQNVVQNANYPQENYQQQSPYMQTDPVQQQWDPAGTADVYPGQQYLEDVKREPYYYNQNRYT